MTNKVKKRESYKRKKMKKINKISRIYMCYFLNFIVGISDYRTEETGKSNFSILISLTIFINYNGKSGRNEFIA